MAGQYIDMKAGDGSGSFRGYLALPARQGARPGARAGDLRRQQDHARRGRLLRRRRLRRARARHLLASEPNVELGYTEADWQKRVRLLPGLRRGQGHGRHPDGDHGAARPSRGATARSACWASAWAASWRIWPRPHRCRCRGRLLRRRHRGRARRSRQDRSRWCCTSPSTTNSARPRRARRSSGAQGPARHAPRLPRRGSRLRARRRRSLPQALGADGARAHHRRAQGRDGPHYDLSALWDKHCEYEFGTRNVDDTMRRWSPSRT